MSSEPQHQQFNKTKFILFALTIYGIINGYLFYHGLIAVQAFGGSVFGYSFVALVVILAFPMGRLVMHRWPSSVASFLNKIGSIYLGAMVYFLILTFSLDFIHLGLTVISISRESPIVVQGIFWTVILLVLGVLSYGYRHALNFSVNTLQLPIPFPQTANQMPFRIVMFSDIHLGTVIHVPQLQKIVQTVNQLNPQLILIPGDILDENLPSRWWESYLHPLKDLTADYGVFATTGNHEYFTNKREAVQAIEATGITLLEDQAVVLPNGIILIGRRDVTGTYFGEQRKDLKQLLKTSTPDTPVIVMDHQPVALKEAKQAGITLLLSGHTHDGQFWPLNLLNRRIWELSYGYRQMGKTHVYVTSGIGAWGPPIRVGTQAEIVVIDLVPDSSP